jgi:hypothetical protein
VFDRDGFRHPRSHPDQSGLRSNIRRSPVLTVSFQRVTGYCRSLLGATTTPHGSLHHARYGSESGTGSTSLVWTRPHR